MFSLQHLCQKLPKSINVHWSYSVLHHCHLFWDTVYYNWPYGRLTLPEQHCCNVVHGLTPLLCGILLHPVLYTTVGSKTSWVLYAWCVDHAAPHQPNQTPRSVVFGWVGGGRVYHAPLPSFSVHRLQLCVSVVNRMEDVSLEVECWTEKYFRLFFCL